MRKVYCKKDLVWEKNGVQYFWAGESYEVSRADSSGISVYTEINSNSPRSAFFLKWDSTVNYQVGYMVFSDYFIFLDEFRERKLRELGI